MKKRDELENPNSCLNKAAAGELIFVLLERDPAAADAVEYWCSRRVAIGLNTVDDDKIKTAMQWVDDAREKQARRRMYEDLEETIETNCVVCGVEWVDAENGFDTCAGCLAKA